MCPRSLRDPVIQAALAVTAALAEAKREREGFRRKKEIDSVLARASELVQKGDFESARYALEDIIKSYPDSRELTDAAARIRARLEEGERQREIAQLTASIEQAIAVREWGHAVTRADGALEKFPHEDIFARLKRRAEEGKYKADIDDVEASALAARRAGDLARAAEIVAAGRQRWDKEKRLSKLSDEIEDTRADEGVAAAKALADAGNYAEAERKIGEVLARWPKFSSALDLAQSIAARNAARSREAQMAEKIRSGVYTLPPVKPPAKKRQTIYIGAAVGVLAAVGIILVATHKPSGTVQPTKADHTKQPKTPQPATPQPEVKQPPVVVNPPAASKGTAVIPSGSSKAPAERKGAAPPKDNGIPPAKASSKKVIETPGQTPALVTTQPQPPPVAAKAEPQCTMKPFDYSNWHDVKSGDMVWTGNLPTGGEGEIAYRAGSTNRAKGEILEPGIPVKFSFTPETVQMIAGPSVRNCWEPHLVVRNTGPAVTRITIHWVLLPN